ncbi:MAG: hypothetical protein IJ299_03345 [Oscillospiraceae bacterium]|nr:hypothetical protein [Oscillospiraceae bacterium]
MRVLRLLCLAGLLMSLCGCFDYNELNMQEMVSGAGIDAAENGVRVSVVCAPTGGIEDKEGKRYTSDGGSFFEAVRELSGFADKKLYWGHARCLLIGEDAAYLTDEILNTVLRVQDVYLDIAPVIVKGASAEELIKATPPGGSDVFESISDMLANEANSRRFFAKRVWEILRERENSGEYILPTAALSEGKVHLSGGAVMKDGNIKGFLDGEQMLLLSLMTENGAGGYLPTLGLPNGGHASFEILSNDIKREKDGDKTELRVKCVLSPASVQGDGKKEDMEQIASKYLDNGFSKLIAYSEKNGFGDIFGADGKNLVVKCEVTVSDILGNR